MAKSLRSKVKRDFRSKKREQGVYAASAAARLNRLNAKLKSVVSQDLEDEDPEGQDEVPGWCWFAAFGLLNAEDISLDSLDSLNPVESLRLIQDFAGKQD